MALRKIVLAASAVMGSAWALSTEDMLAAPRRSTANVNPSGEIALFSSTRYNWTTHKSKTTWHILDIASGNITDAPFDSAVSEVVWVGPVNTSILYINETNEEVPGGVTLWTADVRDFAPTLVASLNAPFAGLKAVQTKSGNINFVVNTKAYWNNGSAYNEELASKPLSSGGLYDNTFVRHWNEYITHERFSIFSGVLTAEKANATGSGKLSFNGKVKNLLWGINATVTRPETPVQPFGDQGDYDISPDGKTVAFLTKSPHLSKANYTASYIYLVPHDGSEVAVPVNGPNTSAPKTAQGASGYPRWSPDGTKLAYGQQDGIYYESDRFKLYVATVDGLKSEVKSVAEDWDSTPSGLAWGPEGHLYVASELNAMNRLWVVPYEAEASYKPENFTGEDTYVSDFSVLPDGSVLVSAASGWTSRMFYVQKPGSDKKVLFTANEVDPELAGLQENSTTYFWFQNKDGDNIQTFVFLPTDFDPAKKYPLAFIVHGGPQVAQGDNWSTRWNLRLWADQGFVVTTVQFTGTPSYGQEFTDKIANNWGGTPYTDLEEAFEYMRKNIPYIDTDNAIAAGASYGAFMMNWIQGHALGKKFKAIVSHDGKLSQRGAYATEELWFIQKDQNGTVWDNPENYALWDPLDYVGNFTTPQFIVHNDLDYRVVVSDGVMLFNILQSRGVPSRFLHFPDEGHWVLNRENSLLWHKYIFNWIRYYTGQDKELIQDPVIKQ
ncbi:alpha/beta-hydrolase [Westerdykella ornata]|uniref:Dipeptidyl-peptidase V n=1 Tax=Westerdykella ornata TaxID=318751 RepID=A0A6A6JXU1_WESOR|nr:alpha/beta-hydrolase [Westerdykella ornata]KAF2280638.1 alpha/beta-hydrolase [Westerdykella ornata]